MRMESSDKVRAVVKNTVKKKQSQGGEAATSFSHLTRDTFQETLHTLHKECAELLELTKQQAADTKVQHERQLLEARSDLKAAIVELQQEKQRSVILLTFRIITIESAQKSLELDNLKARVTVLKAGGASFSSREDERHHKSVLQADRLQILLEEQRKENTILKTQLLQTLNQLYEREESLTTYTKHQEDSFLPEQFLECSASPLDDEEGMLPDNMEHQEDSFLPEQFLVRSGSPLDDEEGMLPDNMEHQEDSFLPEQFLECSGSPLDDEEGMLPDNMEHQEDSFLPEQFLECSASPLDDKEGMLPDNMEHQEDSFLPEQFLGCSASPLDDEEGMLPDNMEHQEDSFLPEQFLVRSGSPLDDEEGMLPDNMEHQEDSFLPEQFLECSASPLDDKEGMLPDNMEHQEDSFLPEQFLVRSGSPLDDEEGMLPDNMEHQEDSFLPEQFLECSASPIVKEEERMTSDMSMVIAPVSEALFTNYSSALQTSPVSTLDPDSKDILSCSSGPSLKTLCHPLAAQPKMADAKSLINNKKRGGLIQRVLKKTMSLADKKWSKAPLAPAQFRTYFYSINTFCGVLNLGGLHYY
ncbi:uncharacterized protein LOC118416879 isoform X4 [Branchiostoma floridae]|uniref:Uncharacterized protein LOC118416879 isoform X4 n=1 Tax=Branchiostoma floridae TaxID=7739 RepID=A0A9J7MTB3_BRAFL|nr:uncharacterized protein LOC118416879 isoform X4 [Branchiostoma floridae]